MEQIERKGVFILHNPPFLFFSVPKENTAFNSCTIRSETLNLVLTSPFRNLAFFRQEDQAAERHICVLLRLCKKLQHGLRQTSVRDWLLFQDEP